MLIFWGETLLRLRFVPLLFWECIPYGICIASCLVLYKIRIIHVVIMVLYCFSYCELLFFPLVGLKVCGCNRIIQIYACRMIGGYEFFIVCTYLD